MTKEYKTNEEFWHLLEEANVSESLASAIVNDRGDMTETKEKRAKMLARESHVFAHKAWMIFFQLNGLSRGERPNLRACHASRTVLEV